MLTFKKVTLEDKDIFNSYLENYSSELITYTFTSFFIWQEWDNYSWQEIDDTLCISANINGINCLFPPIATDTEKIINVTQKIINFYQENQLPLIFAEADSKIVNLYQQAFPHLFQYEEDLNGANYIYNISDLTLLKGRNYNSKRNHLNKFKREYPNYQLEPITTANLQLCKDSLDSWYDHHAINNNVHLEYLGAKKALCHFGDLDYIGVCLKINNKVEAFALAEPINQQQVVIHIEKANAKINGAYTAINQMFLAEYWQNYRFVNRAEDMGEPGLRKAKHDLHPCKMEMKYNIVLK